MTPALVLSASTADLNEERAPFRLPIAEICVVVVTSRVLRRSSCGQRSAATSCETRLLTSSPEPTPEAVIDAKSCPFRLRLNGHVEQRSAALPAGEPQGLFARDLAHQVPIGVSHRDHHAAAGIVDAEL